jgi:hypothetical protein
MGNFPNKFLKLQMKRKNRLKCKINCELGRPGERPASFFNCCLHDLRLESKPNVTLREDHRLGVFENMVLRIIYGPMRDEVTGEWRKLHNEELHYLYSYLFFNGATVHLLIGLID